MLLLKKVIKNNTFIPFYHFSRYCHDTPANIYLFKVNNGNTRKKGVKYVQTNIKETRKICFTLFLVFLFLTLNIFLFAVAQCLEQQTQKLQIRVPLAWAVASSTARHDDHKSLYKVDAAIMWLYRGCIAKQLKVVPVGNKFNKEFSSVSKLKLELNYTKL